MLSAAQALRMASISAWQVGSWVLVTCVGAGDLAEAAGDDFSVLHHHRAERATVSGLHVFDGQANGFAHEFGVGGSYG